VKTKDSASNMSASSQFSNIDNTSFDIDDIQ
jgi:hypothetical protein